MKKVIIIFCLFGILIQGHSQTTLNEIYTDPGANKSEFFELFNSSPSSIPQSVDNYTVLTYRNNNGIEGWYIIDLPALTVGPKQFFVGAAASPFDVQQLSNVVADFNWNSSTFRNSTTGSIRFAQLNAGRTAFNTAEAPNPVNDVLAGGNGKDYFVFVFVNDKFSNGFIGGTSSTIYPSFITNMPPLVINCNWGSFTVNFSAPGIPGSSLKAFEKVVSAPGSDNGYARTSDGNCGAWVKTSNSPTHTPRLSNGASNNSNSELTTTEFIQCGVPAGKSTLRFDITGVTGSITEASDFPVEVQVYKDLGTGGQLDPLDALVGTKYIATIGASADTIHFPQTANILVVYKTQRGCYDKIAIPSTGCAPLPVGLLSFSASRSLDAVMLRWSTAFEQNNRGFDIERNTNGNWEKIGFVSSMALNGNSSDNLTYSFVDRNNTSKGISQYRLRQVDIDAKATYSDVRAVRGDGQIGKITIYPNPTADGKVNILFDDANVVRTVTVSDMSGRLVKEVRAISNNNITISNLQSGMYTVKIAVPETGEQVVQKIVVNKR